MTDFTEQDLSGSTFRRVDLSRSTLQEVRLSGADVRDADLSDLRVRAAWLKGVRMTGVAEPCRAHRSTMCRRSMSKSWRVKNNASSRRRWTI